MFSEYRSLGNWGLVPEKRENMGGIGDREKVKKVVELQYSKVKKNKLHNCTF